jgi:hypothetical protein
MQHSQALPKELRTALASKKKRKAAVSDWSCGTTLSGGPKSSQLPSKLNSGKRKGNGPVNTNDSFEPAKRSPASDT